MKKSNTMTIKEMKEYIETELGHEKVLQMAGEPNNFNYLFMIANDMGLINPKEW